MEPDRFKAGFGLRCVFLPLQSIYQSFYPPAIGAQVMIADAAARINHQLRSMLIRPGKHARIDIVPEAQQPGDCAEAQRKLAVIMQQFRPSRIGRDEPAKFHEQ